MRTSTTHQTSSLLQPIKTSSSSSSSHLLDMSIPRAQAVTPPRPPPLPALPPINTHPSPSNSPTPSPSTSASPSSFAASPLPLKPSRPIVSLQEPSNKKGPSKPKKLFRRVRAVFRSFPIISPVCKMPLPGHDYGHIHGGTRMTGTLFGHRKSRVNLAIQEAPQTLPLLLLELTIPTGKLLHDMAIGLVRIALECEKRPHEKSKIIDEPIWSMYCNGKKSGYGVKREATDEDLNVMKILHVISMGAGVIPADGVEHSDGELTYMRSHFERVIGSKDSETYYMMNPDGNNGPELSIFFVRI